MREIDFHYTSFWIQIHNLPVNCLSCEIAQKLGEMIGNVEEIDCDGTSRWTGPFMRIRIQMDVTLPLRHGCKLRTNEGKEVWCPIQYEKLPDFCFTCGKFGHSLRECQQSGSLNNNCHEYGEWLKATWVKKEGRFLGEVGGREVAGRGRNVGE